ncbi:MAG: BTAD domain-containing putative transcriptional regulator, partial [Spirochaetota bacterium]|nr:BTAD domain-containing putative transcriptional regulator [Spirochaetota bacterium]
MLQRINILNTKLLLPPAVDTIERERLYPILKEIPKKRITTVVAGAGYGKTTLIAQASKQLDLDTVWYRLDRSDRDFVTFINYLIAGIKKYLPDLETNLDIQSKKPQSISREHEAILNVLVSNIEESLINDIIIVLDDYHLVRDSKEIRVLMQFLFEFLPSKVHFIIISRTDPNLPLSRLKAQRKVLEISEKELVFDIFEIEQLFSQLFNISLQADNLKIILKKTDGWVSGLILFYHSVRGKNQKEIKRLLLQLKGSHRNMSIYLEENVYDLLQDEVKDFLIKTSILSRINADFCNKLLGISNSTDILKGLEEDHLFTYPSDEEREWYYYHHLFRDFLHTKLQYVLSKDAIHKLHKDAAILWRNYEEDEETLRHYLLAENWGEAWMLLRRIVMRFINEGRVHLVNSYLEKIPDSYISKEPWIQYTQGIVKELNGNTKDAIWAYKRAYNLFNTIGSSEGVILCMTSLGYNYLIIGEFEKAEMNLREVLNNLDNSSIDSIDILGHLIFISSHLGKMNVADQYYSMAVTLLNKLNSQESSVGIYINHGFRFILSGDFKTAIKLGEQARELALKFGFYKQLAMSYHLISISCFYLGLSTKGLENARQGLNLVKEMEYHYNTRAWLLLDIALNFSIEKDTSAEHYESILKRDHSFERVSNLLIGVDLSGTDMEYTSKAIMNCIESMRIFQETESHWRQAYVYQALHYIYKYSGYNVAAEECIKAGLKILEGLMLPIEEGILKAHLIEFLLNKKQWDNALPLLGDAHELVEGSKFGVCLIDILYARYLWEQGDKDIAMDKLLTGLQQCEENGYNIWIIFGKYWLVPLLLELFAQGKMQSYIHTIFKEAGLYPKEELLLFQKNNDPKISKVASVILDEMDKISPEGIKVYCFGNFRVFRGNDEIPATRWRSKKAKMLFKYLVYMRSRGFLPKEVLMELLWPYEDPRKTVNHLHDALSSLRKILEPEIVRGESSSYLLREGDSYKIYLGDGGWVDVDKFREEMRLVKEGNDLDDSLIHCLNAESILQGELFEEDRYVQWCIDERERFKEEQIELFSTIIKHYKIKEDYEKCIEYANKSLKQDKYAENIYQELMICYSIL